MEGLAVQGCYLLCTKWQPQIVTVFWLMFSSYHAAQWKRHSPSPVNEKLWRAFANLYAVQDLDWHSVEMSRVCVCVFGLVLFCFIYGENNLYTSFNKRTVTLSWIDIDKYDRLKLFFWNFDDPCD